MARKTKKMLLVESEQGRPLERLLPELINERGLTATAERLQVSKSTVGYWMLKLGIRMGRAVLSPGETLEITSGRS